MAVQAVSDLCPLHGLNASVLVALPQILVLRLRLLLLYIVLGSLLLKFVISWILEVLLIIELRLGF